MKRHGVRLGRLESRRRRRERRDAGSICMVVIDLLTPTVLELARMSVRGAGLSDSLKRRPAWRRYTSSSDGRATATDAALTPGRSSAASTTGTAAAPSSAAGRYVAAGDDHVPHRGQALPGPPDPGRVGVSAELDLHGVAAQLALELVGRARRDDPPAVHDRQPARPAGRPPPGSAWSAGWSARRRRRAARSPAHMAGADSGSRPAVGSSRNSTAGRWIRPSATSSRRCMPPE